MMLLKYGTILFIIFNTEVTSASLKCCTSGRNVVGKGKCEDGSKITLDCDLYMLESDVSGENFTVDKYQQLVFPSTNRVITRDRYCTTKTQSLEDVFLVCFEEEDNTNNGWLGRAICSIISMVFLTATLVVYFLVPELRDLQGQCVSHSILGLSIAFLSLSIMQLNGHLSDTACLITAFMIYFTFLYCFFWLNTLSFHIWKSVVKPHMMGTKKQWRIIYHVYGIGAPIIFLVVLLIAHHVDGNHIKPNIGVSSCWFHDMGATYAYFYGPIATLLCINFILFIWTSIILWKDSKDIPAGKIKPLKYKLLLYVKLFIIMGLTWIFEVLSAVFESYGQVLDVIWNITDYINALQGVLIFILLVVTRKKALKGLAKRGILCINFPPDWKTMHDEEECEYTNDEEQLSQVK